MIVVNHDDDGILNIIPGYKPGNDSVIEPSLLDMLPPPADCTEAQRQTAIGLYVSQDSSKLSEYLRNTQARIYREFYGNPKKRTIGHKLYHLYAMRDIIHEAMRRKGVPTHGSPTPTLDKMVLDKTLDDLENKLATIIPSGTSAATETTSNYIPLEKLDVRSVRTAATS